MDVGGSRGLFTTGRCALTMDWGDIGTLAPGTYAQDKTGATITPGWKEVLDRATGKLVPCDATTCPNAVDGVNYAPFASFGGWSGAVNAAAPKAQQDAAYDFLSYMSSPAISGVDVTLGKTGYNPYRTSQFENIQPWLDAGLSEAAATNYLGAIKASLKSPNMVLDMRIPLTKRYEQDVLDTASRSTSPESSMPPAPSRRSRTAGMPSPTRSERTSSSLPTSPVLASSDSSLDLEPQEPVPSGSALGPGPRVERRTRSARGVPTVRPGGCSSGPPSSSSSSSRSSRSSPRSPCRSPGWRSTRAASTSSSSASPTTSSSCSASSGRTSSVS